MSKFQALRDAVARDEHVGHPSFAALRPYLEKSINACESLAAKKVELSRDARLSDVGRAEQLRDIAGLHAPTLAKTERFLTKARKANQQKRESLLPNVKNPNDVVEAMQRQEMRAIYRTKPPAEVIGIVSDANAPRLAIEAVFEGSQLTHGIPQRQVDELRNVVAERTCPAQMEALRQEAAALAFAGTVVEDARGTLSDAATFPRIGHGAALSEAFTKWFATMAGSADESTENAEYARATGEIIVPSSFVDMVKSMDTADRSKLGEFLTRQTF